MGKLEAGARKTGVQAMKPHKFRVGERVRVVLEWEDYLSLRFWRVDYHLP